MVLRCIQRRSIQTEEQDSFVRLPSSTLNKWEYVPGVDGKCLPIHDPSARSCKCAHIAPLNHIYPKQHPSFPKSLALILSPWWSVLHPQNSPFTPYKRKRRSSTSFRAVVGPGEIGPLILCMEALGRRLKGDTFPSKIHGDRMNKLRLVFPYCPPNMRVR